MKENPYKAPSEIGETDDLGWRRVCGLCAWAMFGTVVVANLAHWIIDAR